MHLSVTGASLGCMGMPIFFVPDVTLSGVAFGTYFCRSFSIGPLSFIRTPSSCPTDLDAARSDVSDQLTGGVLLRQLHSGHRTQHLADDVITRVAVEAQHHKVQRCALRKHAVG